MSWDEICYCFGRCVRGGPGAVFIFLVGSEESIGGIGLGWFGDLR